jgi:hypothetical protein
MLPELVEFSASTPFRSRFHCLSISYNFRKSQDSPGLPRNFKGSGQSTSTLFENSPNMAD